MTAVPRTSAAGLERMRGQLSQRDWAVLRDLADCRLMSGRHIQRLHHGGDQSAARAARRRLARLSSIGVVTRLPRQVGGIRAGSSGYVYTLSAAGHRLLHPDQPHRRLTDIRDGFLGHTMAVAEVFVRLRLAHQRGDVELLTLETEPRCWRRFQDIGGLDWLKPDLHVVVGIGDEVLHSYVEIDQGTEHSPALMRKLRQYETAYRLGPVRRAADDVFPRVVWLVLDDRRAGLLRRLCRSSGLTADLHSVALQADALIALSGCSGHEPISNERKEVT